MDNAGLSLIFAGLRWLVMKAHHGEDLGRKVPLSHQQAAGLIMGEVQDFLLRLPQQYVIAQREAAGLPEGIAEILFMDQLADIVNQAADEEFFHLFFTQMPGEFLCSKSCPDRMFPEFRGTKDIGALGAEQVDYGTGKNQVAQGLKTDDSDRPGNRRDLLRESVERGIDEPEQFGGQDLVLGNHGFNVFGRSLGLADQLGDLVHDHRQGREGPDLRKNPFPGDFGGGGRTHVCSSRSCFFTIVRISFIIASSRTSLNR